MYQLTCSIVLYNNKTDILKKTINSVLRSKLFKRIYLVDNSENDFLKTLADNSEVEYIFNNNNAGYSRGHNIAIEKAKDNSRYHLVLNPDVYFDEGVLEELYNYMEAHANVGQIMPNVLYENGELQKLCNLLPTPWDLIGRRFFPNQLWFKRMNERYELKGFNYDKCANIPNLSGCFMFLRMEVLEKIKGFDERYFMYMEDVDLTRRVNEIAETVFYPGVSIYHGFQKESYYNFKLLRYHVTSAMKYFNKWGWLFDKQRTLINKKTTKSLHL